MSLKHHPIANIFPLLPETELRELADDIKANGLKQPIWLYEGMILDGRNRYAACEIAGVEPRFETYSGDSPTALVVSLNLRRRDLSPSQKAACSVEALPWLEKEAKCRQIRKSVREKIPEQNKGKATEKAASLVKVNPRYVSDAKAIRGKRPDLFEQVKVGSITIADAKREIKKEEHAAKVEAAKSTPVSRSVSGPFDIVIADPPWRYEHCEAKNREIENQYPTATLEEIFTHKPDSKPDSILFLWATAPLLEQALRVMAVWGFSYRSCAVWDKEKIGMGYWWRIQHELLLVGVKGKPGCPPEHERISSVIKFPRGKHSEKPACVMEWIERCYPGSAKLEMYCRSPRQGWAAWGNEV